MEKNKKSNTLVREQYEKEYENKLNEYHSILDIAEKEILKLKEESEIFLRKISEVTDEKNMFRSLVEDYKN